MPVIGTAGHVDHGKSTLVQALTGRDPDRWAEEKQRGLTIDLGFAWTTLPSGADVGFVDVPGHERFIKNMLAGVDAISVALFVVAADEGWMPQSEEHLAVLDLLGVESAVVALTRADLVDADTLELAMLEIEERLDGTSLAGAPIVPTAAPEGRGIAELTEALDRAVASHAVPDLGRPRLWVDRSFTISGAGTVLTGTLVDGEISIDDSMRVFPEGLDGRVRSLQTHEESVERVGPGSRTAINVVGIERTEVGRGAMLGRSDQWFLTSRFVADLRTVRSLDAPLRERGAYHLHLGSGSWSARLLFLSGDTLEGAGAVVVDLGEPVAVRWGDRLILREVGRQAVVAGGRVLDPDPARRRTEIAPHLEGIRAAGTPDEAAAAILGARGAMSAATLAAQTGGGSAAAGEVIAGLVCDPSWIEAHLAQAAGLVAAFHADNPLRAGMPKASLAERLGIGIAELEGILERSSDLDVVGAAVKSSGFGVTLDDADRQRWEAAASALGAAGFGPPRRAELGLTVEVEHALIRGGELVEVAPDLLYLPDTVDEIVARTRDIGDGFSVADFRDALGITRKHAIPLLEWMDAEGITRRDGDLRRTT